jgi:hypothetical protein
MALAGCGQHLGGGDALDAFSRTAAGGLEMSGWEGMTLAVLSLGSCFASYMLGRESMWKELKNRRQERRRRWEEFDDED